MSRLSAIPLTAAIGLTLAIGSPAAQADEIYGTGQQWMVISAAEFHASEPSCALEYYGNYAYTRPTLCSGSWAGYYEHPLHLPEGAKIYAIRLLAYDNDAANDVSLSIQRVTMTPYGAGSGSSYSYGQVANSAVSTAGQQTDMQGPQSYSINQTFDTYDYPATNAAVFYSLRMIIPASTTNLRAHSVHVYWQRQSAPAPATASFSDVPTSNPFFNDVEQLRKSGITSGCGGGNFCPDSPVTRGQMAAFLNRAFGLHWDWSTN